MRQIGSCTLETRRLRLRPLRMEDAEAMYLNWARDPAVTRFLTWAPHQNADQTRAYLAFCQEQYRNPAVFHWGIVLKDTDTLAGTIGAVRTDEETGTAEIGYALGRAWWGQGIMTEALREVIRFFFMDAGACRVTANHDIHNPASGRVMQKAGMRYEGTLRGGGKNNQGIVDIAVYGLVRKDASALPGVYAQHDPRIPYIPLRLTGSPASVEEVPLPAPFRYALYRTGDRDAWIDIEIHAGELRDHEEGVRVWEKYYGPHEQELEDRMFFVVNARGEKVATATAYYDPFAGDDGKTGWLHWVAVADRAQGQGLSRPLITHVLRHMAHLGYTSCIIPTQTLTWLACRIYLDLGFRPTPESAREQAQGWRILNGLIHHPALSEFGTAVPETPCGTEPALTIRPADVRDLPDIHRILEQSLPCPDEAPVSFSLTPETLRAWMDRENAEIWAAFRDDRLCGAALVSLSAASPSVAVDAICVDPDLRRQGIGRALMEKIREDARKHGAETIHLSLRSCHDAARAFCRALGLIPLQSLWEMSV